MRAAITAPAERSSCFFSMIGKKYQKILDFKYAICYNLFCAKGHFHRGSVPFFAAMQAKEGSDGPFSSLSVHTHDFPYRLSIPTFHTIGETFGASARSVYTGRRKELHGSLICTAGAS